MVSPGLILSTPLKKYVIDAGDGATEEEVVVVGTVVVGELGTVVVVVFGSVVVVEA